MRPSYPLELVDAAIAAGSLDRDSAVLEIGCGTGKLTRAAGRPRSPRPRRRARRQSRRGGAERARRDRRGASSRSRASRTRDLPEAGFDAVFSATAFHWVEPAVGWRRSRALLDADGLLALLTHIAVHDERSAAMEEETAPDRARARARRSGGLDDPADRSKPPSPRRTLRRANVSAVWDGIMNNGRHALTVPEAAGLFEDVDADDGAGAATSRPADEVLAHLRTTSFYFMLDAGPPRALRGRLPRA